jgi:hypothetical protein
LGDRWRRLPLDDKTAMSCYAQLKKEGFLDGERDRNTIYTESDYDLFPVAIADIKNITIERLTGKRKRPVQEGGFFKYTCSFPINLEKFMIFSGLNGTTAKIICGDNCVVYACKQAGVDAETILNMKRLFKTRQLPQTKLKILAEECKIRFEIKLDNKMAKVYEPKGEHRYSIELYLIENHYLLNERIEMSPYFIQHYEEIMKNEKIKNWSLKKKQLICKYDSRRDEYSNRMLKTSYSIKKIIKTLKKCGYLKPIHHGDYITYASTIYQEDLEESESLEYDPL